MGDNNKGYSRRSVNRSNGKEKLDIYNTDGHPVKGDGHSSFHAEKDSDGKTKMTFNNRETGEKTTSSCYLTSACMKHYLEDFNHNCYELAVLRWFRDNFVPKEDVEHYYETAPLIVNAIDGEEQKDLVYDYVYDNVVNYCVKAIENGDYDIAYIRYKSSILSLEETFARNPLQERLVKTLRLATV